MSKRKNRQASVNVIKGASPVNITKAANESKAADTEQNGSYGSQTINPPYPMKELRRLVEMSTILKQCITAYKRNIVGFGVALQYNEDESQMDETPEMKREWDLVRETLKYFHFDKSFEDLFAQAIEHREECGNGYIEILRDGTGMPVEGNNLEPEYIRCTTLGEATPVSFTRNGRTFTRMARFRKYHQQVGAHSIWFKEFGDPRRMNWRTGAYVTEGQVISEADEASEILHLKVGDGPYGIPRWIGHLIHMYGARKAEELNYRYFQQGRHNPMAIILSNAELTDDSAAQLQEYASTVEGVENAYKFLVIQTNTSETADSLLDDTKPKASVELKPMAELLQKDALFLEYDEKHRQKVQSAFGLPDIYTGYSRDFNRATADTARIITEEQVFEPERNSLEWVINNKLLLPYELKHVVMMFKKPEISDTEALVALFDRYIAGHAITPNDLREHAARTMNKEYEPFDIPQADEPIGLNASPSPQASDPLALFKAEDGGNPFINLLKDVRDAIEELNPNVPSR